MSKSKESGEKSGISKIVNPTGCRDPYFVQNNILLLKLPIQK